jgi:hypothetical protein
MSKYYYEIPTYYELPHENKLLHLQGQLIDDHDNPCNYIRRKDYILRVLIPLTISMLLFEISLPTFEIVEIPECIASFKLDSS